MGKRNRENKGGIVYSTDPSFSLSNGEEREPSAPLAPAEQKLYIRLDTRHRAGKAVTIVSDFSGTDAELEELGKQLKSHCGTGGSVKFREILVQGDHRDKILAWLLAHGYTRTKKR